MFCGAMAELASRIVDKGLASDCVVIETVFQNIAIMFAVRQERCCGAEAGVEFRVHLGWLGDACGRVAGGL